uniref:TVP38 protein n=1 Tax=Fopius arisanus TaxID=64838 RepID=A0A0C9QD46_9HYME
MMELLWLEGSSTASTWLTTVLTRPSSGYLQVLRNLNWLIISIGDLLGCYESCRWYRLIDRAFAVNVICGGDKFIGDIGVTIVDINSYNKLGGGELKQEIEILGEEEEGGDKEGGKDYYRCGGPGGRAAAA